MFDASARATRGAVAVRLAVCLAVCLGVSAICVVSRASAGLANEVGAGDEPLVLRGDGATTFAYKPLDVSSPRPAVVYLNGRCGVTTNGCPHFRAGVEPFGWLVCPPANVRCPGGGASWGGAPSERRALVDAAVADVASADRPHRILPGGVDRPGARAPETWKVHGSAAHRRRRRAGRRLAARRGGVARGARGRALRRRRRPHGAAGEEARGRRDGGALRRPRSRRSHLRRGATGGARGGARVARRAIGASPRPRRSALTLVARRLLP